MRKTIGLFAFFAGALMAQQNAPPKFEVVSIRPVPANAPLLMREQGFTPVLPGGQFIDTRTGLFSMIVIAYNVKNPSAQLLGLPEWTKNQSYAVSAKPAEGFPSLPPAENHEQVRLMLRTLLAERFKLKLHIETRQESIFNLEVAKGGTKIKEVDPPVPPAKAGNVGAAVSNTDGRMVGNKSTMAGIAVALAIFLKRPVIDKTGLSGYYDFDVKWRTSEPPGGQPSSPEFGVEGAALLISMLQDQLGLRLTKATGQVEYWIVDHVEQPSEN